MSRVQFTRPDAFPPIVKNLIIINALVLFAHVMMPQYAINQRLALYPFVSELYSPYQMVTHMFGHFDLGHLFFNMLGLWVFGARLENIWGPARFLFFYLICGLMAGLAHQLIDFYRISQSNSMETYLSAQYSTAMGASGAVMGVAVGFAYLFPNTVFNMMFPPIPVKAKWLVLFYVLADVFGVFSRSASNVGHIAHLGGAVTGFIIVLIWNKTNRRGFY